MQGAGAPWLHKKQLPHNCIRSNCPVSSCCPWQLEEQLLPQLCEEQLPWDHASSKSHLWPYEEQPPHDHTRSGWPTTVWGVAATCNCMTHHQAHNYRHMSHATWNLYPSVRGKMGRQKNNSQRKEKEYSPEKKLNETEACNMSQKELRIRIYTVHKPDG